MAPHAKSEAIVCIISTFKPDGALCAQALGAAETLNSILKHEKKVIIPGTEGTRQEAVGIESL